MTVPTPLRSATNQSTYSSGLPATATAPNDSPLWIKRRLDVALMECEVTSGVSQTQAQSAAMAKAAADFDAANSSLTSMLNKLMSDLSVLSVAWKGIAAGEFEKVKTQYAKDLSDLNRALAETAEAIRTAGVSYEVSDSEAAARVTRSGGGFTLPL